MRMHAPLQEPPIERSHIVAPSISIQTMSFGIVGGAPTRPSLEAMATSTPTVPQDTKIGGLKLEMPKKYTGSCVLAISGWLIKMERYFRFVKYLADIWVDVVTTRITNAAQAWMDKALQDVHLGRCNPWASWADFR